MIRGLPLRRIVLLAAPGGLIGALVVLGVFGPGQERFVWVPYTAFCAIVIARRGGDAAIRIAAVVGFLSGAASTLVQGIFVETMLANNAWMADRFSGQPEGFSVQYFVLMLVPFIGVASALVTAVSTYLVGRAFGRREAGSSK